MPTENDATKELLNDLATELARVDEPEIVDARATRLPISAEQLQHARTLKIRTSDGTEIEIPLGEFTVTPGPAARPQPKIVGFQRCGNCLKKLDRYDDAEMNHHIAQKHAVEDCEKRVAANIQHRELVEDFAEQQAALSPATKALIASMSTPEPPFISGSSRRLPALPPVNPPWLGPAAEPTTARRSPWWKFWK